MMRAGARRRQAVGRLERQLPELPARLPASPSRTITYDGSNSRGAFCEVHAFHSFNGVEQRVVEDLSGYIARPR